MSDFEDHIDDQLLKLAAHPRRRSDNIHQAVPVEEILAAARTSTSIGILWKSEEEMEDPYPYEGKYKDETDKRE